MAHAIANTHIDIQRTQNSQNNFVHKFGDYKLIDFTTFHKAVIKTICYCIKTGEQTRGIE